MLIRKTQRGFTLIELMIAALIFALLLALGMPAYQNWAARTKVRVAAESIMAGLVLARNQSLQLNDTVHFYLTDSLTSTCALSNTGTNWVVSRSTPAGLCATAPSDTVAPRIIQTRPGAEAGKSASISAVNSTAGTANRIIFTGLGRVQVTTPPSIAMNPIATIHVTYPQRGTCELAGGPVRCLDIQISTGGEARICDPKITNTSDPRAC